MKAENQNPVNDDNLTRKLTSWIENKFMMQTQIHKFDAVVMLRNARAYYVTFLICLFRPALIAAAIYRKMAEAKLYT